MCVSQGRGIEVDHVGKGVVEDDDDDEWMDGWIWIERLKVLE